MVFLRHKGSVPHSLLALYGRCTSYAFKRCVTTFIEPDSDSELQLDVPRYVPYQDSPTTVVHKRGMELLHDPWYNKGTAFPADERERLGIRGLLPPRELDIRLQESRFMNDYYAARAPIQPDEEKTGGVTVEMTRRWKLLQELQDRNETLFYKILVNHFVEMAPIVYTPTVGWVCLNYHILYRRPRGMFFSAKDKGHMASMVWNWPATKVSAIVVTDGSRILGLGDLGLNGLGIPVGKLDLYCAAAGFYPANVLPIVIDVGTDNEEMRNDPLYAGLRQPRIKGAEYYAIMDEFVHAVMCRWPDVVLQFEDFSNEHALVLLNRYRNFHRVFNDDIQGTAATALAGMYGAMRVLGRGPDALREQRIVCVGAGSAGMGVVSMIAAGMQHQGLSPLEACSRFWVLDKFGLVTLKREALESHVKAFARHEVDQEGMSLLEVVRTVRPTILLGLSGAGRIFTPEVLSLMAELCPQQRPIIFSMSNPVSKMECSSEEAVMHTRGAAIFASGSPQPDVEYEGKIRVASQANNMYIFPGVALGAWLGRTRGISDNMLMKAAEYLPTMISQEHVEKGSVYPQLSQIRDISVRIAAQVIKVAAEEGIAQGNCLTYLKRGDSHLMRFIRRSMFNPEYRALVHLPVGVEE